MLRHLHHRGDSVCDEQAFVIDAADDRVAAERGPTSPVRRRRSLGEQWAARWSAIPFAPVCNLRPDRAPRVGGYCCPICWRCSGVLAALSLVTTPAALGALPRWAIACGAIVIAAPCVVDAVLQYRFGHESTNPRRAVTGWLFGSSLAVLLDLVR